MTNDPRAILRDAGVNVPEVDALYESGELCRYEHDEYGKRLKHPHYMELECAPLDAAILALTRLVVRACPGCKHWDEGDPDTCRLLACPVHQPFGCRCWEGLDS